MLRRLQTVSAAVLVARCMFADAVPRNGGGAFIGLDCYDYADKMYGTSGACGAWTQSYSCDSLFCENCLMSGYCDATCGYCNVTGSSLAPTPRPVPAPTPKPSVMACTLDCVDYADELYSTTGTCQNWLDNEFTCESFFCANCGFSGASRACAQPSPYTTTAGVVSLSLTCDALPSQGTATRRAHSACSAVTTTTRRSVEHCGGEFDGEVSSTLHTHIFYSEHTPSTHAPPA